jgi:tetratricopeptide (TPR) repeat protein
MRQWREGPAMKPVKCIVTAVAVALLAAFTVSAIAANSGDRFRVAQANVGDRVALVIGNASYPDDNKKLTQPINDTQALAEELRRSGFEVIEGKDLTKQKLEAALKNFYSKIRPGSAALFFFSGYGIQAGKQSYLIPVDAQIWLEGEVKRDGVTVESILNNMNEAGAAIKIVIIDAARRNPFERRFRGFSAGLASLNVPRGTLAMYSAEPDKPANESDGENSLFVSELLKEMRSPGSNAETVFRNTRLGVSSASRNEQVPFVSSSLTREFFFNKASAPPPEPTPPKPTPPKPTPPTPPPPTPPPPTPPPPTPPPPTPPPPTPPPPTPPPPTPPRDSTILKWDALIQADPNNADAYFGRGQAWAQRDQYQLASKDFSEAIRIEPNFPEALNNRCFLRAVMGQLEDALSDCNEAIRLRKDYADALDSRGLTHLKLGQYNSAIADFDAAIRIDPKMASALFGRGTAKLKRGDRAGGNADIRSAKSIDPKIAQDYEKYGVR